MLPSSEQTSTNSKDDTEPHSVTVEAKGYIRRISTSSTAALFFICICLIGLLVVVVYFYLESIGFMLVMIARAPYSERPGVEKLTTERLIMQLREMHPDIDFDALIREERCRGEILHLRRLHPDINWDSILCEAAARRLRDAYPYIRWDMILCGELPYVLRARYPFIDWSRIITEDACGREIERLRLCNPDMDWTEILCEARIDTLRRKFPYLNWDGIVCEERIRRLRETYPNVNFDRLIQDELCETEINQLKCQYPQIDWQSMICVERSRWLRARHPLVHWENIINEERVAQLRRLYPYIDWSNVIQNQLCEKEISNLKNRFPQLDWEGIVRGGDVELIRISRNLAISRLNARFPNVTWEEVIEEDLNDCVIRRLRRKHPYLDWNAITTAIFHPISLKSVNFKDPEACKVYRKLVPCLEELYPCVDWRYFVEKKYASPYINWDYIIECDIARQHLHDGTVLKCDIIKRLQRRYPLIDWKAFQNIGMDRMQCQHPYIHWTVILEELSNDRVFELTPTPPMLSVNPNSPMIVKARTISRTARLQQESQLINLTGVIAKEKRSRRRRDVCPQGGDFEPPLVKNEFAEKSFTNAGRTQNHQDPCDIIINNLRRQIQRSNETNN